MSIFATFDEQGFPAAFYDEQLHGEKNTEGSQIPAGAIEITEQQWRDFIDHAGLRRWDGSDVVAFQPPGPTEAELWSVLRAERDRLLGESDWVILRNLETAEPVPPAWLAYRQALRDLPADTVDPANPVWPQPPALD